MTKFFPSNDRPEPTESEWLDELAAPAASAEPAGAATTGPRSYYSALAAAADLRNGTQPAEARIPQPRQEAAGTGAPSTGPIPRLTADQVDRLIHRLDGGTDGAVDTAAGAHGSATAEQSSASPETNTAEQSDQVASTATAEQPDEVAGAATDEQSAQVAATGARATRTQGRSKVRKPLLVLAAAALCALTVGGGTVAAMNKDVSVVVDGSARQVSTLSGSVSGALAAAGISPGAHDAVAPDVHAAISDGSTIVVDRGRQLTLTIDGTQRTVWTTARTLDAALTQLGAGADLNVAANRSREIPLDGLAVTASTLHTVRLSVAGQPATSSTSAATTVGQLLAAQHVVLGARDRVTPAPSAPLTNGATVTVDRVAVTSTTSTRVLPQPVARTVADAALAKGTKKIVQPGRAGSQRISYEVTTVNGQQTAKREVARTTVVAPVARVTHVGTKAAPVAPVAPVAPKSTFTYSGSQVLTNDTSFGVNWDGLAMCESTHNPKAINANPSAGLPTYGMFQFDLPTWESVGGSGNPIDASPQEQLMRAKLLYQSRGLEPWACRDAAH